MSSSNCCFLTWIQLSQEAGQVVWYSHLFQNFPQFIVIHTVKDFGIVNKAEIGVFLELSCFFDDPASDHMSLVQFSCSVMSDSLWPHESQHASLSITNSRSSLRLTSIESAMPSSHLILYRLLLLLPSIPPSIRVFSNESTLCMRWPKYWSFSFSISPSKEHPWLISFRMDWLDLLAVQGTLKSLLQHHSSKASILWCSAFFTVQLSHPYVTTGKTIALTRRPFVGKVIRELQIKTIIKYHYIPVRIANDHKIDTTKFWWGCGRQEFSFTADGSVKNGITTLEDSLAISQKAKHSLLYDPAIMLPGIYDNELKTLSTQKHTHRCL